MSSARKAALALPVFFLSDDLGYENSEAAFYGRVAGQTGLAPFTFSEILEHCLEPTLRDGLVHVGKLIFWCIAFRILTQSGWSDYLLTFS